MKNVWNKFLFNSLKNPYSLFKLYKTFIIKQNGSQHNGFINLLYHRFRNDLNFIHLVFDQKYSFCTTLWKPVTAQYNNGWCSVSINKTYLCIRGAWEASQSYEILCHVMKLNWILWGNTIRNVQTDSRTKMNYYIK